MNRIVLFMLALLFPWTGWSATEADHQAQMEHLLNMDFKALSEIRLTSVARKEQTLVDTTAAVTVIDQEEIRRSGLNTLPELLRLVPGLEVARINANNWAITSRGFNAQFSNKLLVLMDGRTLYTPLFAGVNWNLQDVMLNDVERIEVIRGPGGTVWGANAVNGVINIITKKAADTQGGLLTVGGGNLDQVQAGLRYGGHVGDKMDYRVFGKGFQHAEFLTANGAGAKDSWELQHGGIRTDWHLSKRDELTIQGDLYHMTEESSVEQRRGGNLLTRWTRKSQDKIDFSFQMYYDRTFRSNTEETEIFDLDWHHRFDLSKSQEITWGLGFRQTDFNLTNGPLISWVPPRRHDQSPSLFVQDEIAVSDDLKLTIGSKLEHNDYTGLEYQPSARLLWRVVENNTVWAAISRAVRSPSPTDTGFQLTAPLGPTSTLKIWGNPEFTSETVWAYELGYRTQLMPRLSLDVATFYNHYDWLGTTENLPKTFVPFTINQTFANKAEGNTYGLETAANWLVLDNWKLRASHTWLKMNLDLMDNSTDTTTIATANNNPRNQIQLRSYLDLPYDLQLDAALYHVTTLTNLDIPSVLRLDVRLGWQPIKTMSLSLSGHNLLDNQHPEFQGTSIQSSEVPRSFFAKLDWIF
ncbi:MAG: TonB-dependent receptor [Magnetococcales bacterium]|nr:TonB-dependent receptor [Magnetococcales bacterium]